MQKTMQVNQMSWFKNSRDLLESSLSIWTEVWDASGITTFHIPEAEIDESLGQRGSFLYENRLIDSATFMNFLRVISIRWNLKNHSRHPEKKN